MEGMEGTAGATTLRRPLSVAPPRTHAMQCNAVMQLPSAKPANPNSIGETSGDWKRRRQHTVGFAAAVQPSSLPLIEKFERKEGGKEGVESTATDE